jgi:hypothetical protein
MTYNAHVTVDADHRLNAGSTVVVSDPASATPSPTSLVPAS